MNEIKKNIVFICIIGMLIIIVFILGFVLRGNQEKLRNSETDLQYITGKFKSYQTGLDFIVRESKRKSEIIDNLRNGNREFEQNIINLEKTIGILQNTNSEFREFGKRSKEGIELINQGFSGIRTAIDKLDETIKKTEASIMD